MLIGFAQPRLLSGRAVTFQTGLCVHNSATGRSLTRRVPSEVIFRRLSDQTIERYLGDDYQVLASYGHVRDLPENPGKGKFGVDVDHDFEPEYVVADDRKKQVEAIAKAAKRARRVYLATDLDREGEAIAWHVAEAAGVPPAKASRVTFSEITRSAVQEAFRHPRAIDRNLVDAQQARRIVDRLVGYTLTPLLSRKVRGGLSAGRVQSVAVRLVVEREREIAAFAAREYWSLEALLETARGERFSAALVRIDGAPLEVGDEATATAHAEARISPFVQYMAWCGFDVLEPNYRGSTGFGLAFLVGAILALRKQEA